MTKDHKLQILNSRLLFNIVRYAFSFSTTRGLLSYPQHRTFFFVFSIYIPLYSQHYTTYQVRGLTNRLMDREGSFVAKAKQEKEHGQKRARNDNDRLVGCFTCNELLAQLMVEEWNRLDIVEPDRWHHQDVYHIQ